jgi:hypothetical protein
MDGWLKTCKVQTSPQAKPDPQAQAPSNAPAKPLNPAYLAGFPTIDAVKRAIQGSNPVDTLARQAAALSSLSRIVQRMQMAPGRGYLDYTPDEQRLMSEYSLGAYQLSQGYEKSVSPDAAKAFEQLSGRYDLDGAFASQVRGLLSPSTLGEFGKIDRAANAQAQARIDQQRREAEEVRTAAPPSTAANGPFVRNDPGTVAVRRCLENGGGDLECIAKGFTTGMGDLTGVKMTVPDPTGLRFGGTYKTDAGLTIGFNANTAGIGSCGKLEPEIRIYSVTKKGDSLQVQIQTEPKPLLISLGPDGRFSGPAAFDIAGRIIVGYRKYWVEQRRVSDNTVIPGSGHEESEPIYEPKTERCGFASLRASASVHAEGSIVGSIAGVLGGPADPASDRAGTTEAPAGARMSGKYKAADGLQLEFHPTAVELDCGEAHVMRPYSVQNLADRIVVTVNNGNVPFPLALRPDGTLIGSGIVEVAGRVVTGTNATGATYAPRTARCNVNALSPLEAGR